MAHETTVAVAPGDGPAPPGVEVDGPRLRGRTALCATQWLPATPSQRPLTLVWGRWLVEAHGKPRFP